MSALAGPGDVILIDSDCHASIYDGCRLGGAQFMLFKHNDVGDLEKRLRRLGDRTENTLIVVEGIYSMLGDRAMLSDITAVKKKYGACLLVDEAHSLGVLGKQGRGLAEEAGVEDDVDFIVGTFSKSLGAIGGFCVSNHPELELVRYASRPYIFTASSFSLNHRLHPCGFKDFTHTSRVAQPAVGECPEVVSATEGNGFCSWSGAKPHYFRASKDQRKGRGIMEGAFGAWGICKHGIATCHA